MTAWQRLLILIAAVTTLCGCNIRPDQGPPGTIYDQRNRAVIHDPFPGGENLGPQIEGARPMDFERPLSEPTGSQTNPFAGRRFGY